MQDKELLIKGLTISVGEEDFYTRAATEITLCFRSVSPHLTNNSKENSRTHLLLVL